MSRVKISGYMLTCDRCGVQHFVRMIDEHECSADAGWTKWMQHDFEDEPEGWSVVRIGESLDKIELCPSCSRKVANEFMPGRYSAESEGNE